ncbi:hypothetical protein [Aeromonas dhakensis]|uniref:hypothetical protein n=1 Tax=Aeromonas dhakensis TaxID=196024 RepID=UPI0023664922|nr:hypothetical protein [Aeromonas dhakensis]WDF94883.1 hypothetical protein PUB92_00470 [Aeromonas dhakensis]
MKISAKKRNEQLTRICQADIFENVEIIENIEASGAEIKVNKIILPYAICLNQDCDLESDERCRINDDHKDSMLLHFAVAPVFIFDDFLKGEHWGDIFEASKAKKRSDTEVKKIMDNEISRYHYFSFPFSDELPELIIDFKHFFSISVAQRDQLLSRKICSLDDLFREKVNQRFSFYISRIGLPEL